MRSASVDLVEHHRLDTVLGTVRVQVRGSGDAMMFWPSLLMTGDMWAGQAKHFGTDHQVILVDPPGFGGSEKLTKTFTFEECARCIVDILDGLGLPWNENPVPAMDIDDPVLAATAERHRAEAARSWRIRTNPPTRDRSRDRDRAHGLDID